MLDDEPNPEPRNQAYTLNDNREVQKRDATPAELETARAAAIAKLKADAAAWSMRSCWVCNPAHTHFLDDLNDGFLFNCVMGCGRYYYQGIDITEYSRPEDSN